MFSDFDSLQGMAATLSENRADNRNRIRLIPLSRLNPRGQNEDAGVKGCVSGADHGRPLGS